MKFTKYFMPFAALALLASCSDDKIVDQPVNSSPQAGEKAYVSLAIAMPGDSYTRVEDVELNDGDASEYAVKNGVVLIFKAGEAESEEDYTFVTKSDLRSSIWEKDGTHGDITTTAKTAVFEFDAVDVPSSADDLYALVILNKPDGLTIPTTAGSKFSAFNTDLVEANVLGSTTAGWTMTNAALLTNNEVATLVKIDNEKIGTSPENLSPAACIYVQRVAAKIQLGNKNEGTTNTLLIDVKIPGVTSNDNPDQVEINKWALNYTNQKAYPVQKAYNYIIDEDKTSTWFKTSSSAPDYFTSAAAFSCSLEGTTTTHKRIYWAEDPNYDFTFKASTSSEGEKKVEDYFNVITTSSTDAFKTPDNIFYCLENTMDYSKMLQNQTTQFVFEATYWVGGKPTTGNATTAPSFVVIDSWKATLDDLNKNALAVAKADDKIDDVVEGTTTSVEYFRFLKNTSVQKENFYDVVGLEDAAVTAYIKSQGIEGSTLTEEQTQAAILYFLGWDQISSDTKADFYVNGKMYYAAPILHFDGITKPTATAEKRGVAKYDESHLGRFGLVRNNWYVLTVSTISGLGDIDVPVPDDNTPDDPDDKSYLQCEVHILSWAKRTSSYDF